MPTETGLGQLRELDKLLAQPLDVLLRAEADQYGELTGNLSDSLVLFGAGSLGRKTLAGLRTLGIEPHAFSDSDARKHGLLVDGLSVLSPEQAARQFGKTAVFLLTIYVASDPGGVEPILQRLRALGCERVVPFAPLYWKYPAVFLPHYAIDLPHRVLEAAELIRQSAMLFHDAISQAEFLGQIQWRLNPQRAAVPPPATHEIYFPPELFTPTANEVFVDCGAYTGDTLRSILRQSKGRFEKVLAFEPDPGNYRGLREYVDSLARPIRKHIQLSDKALGSRTEQLSFDAAAAASSSVSRGGEIVVQSEPLDVLLAAEAPTWIKMDIEGAEVDALAGATKTISTHQPILAVSVYHRQDHIWRIPSYLHALCETYEFYLRRYSPYVLDDLVLYAIPHHRRL